MSKGIPALISRIVGLSIALAVVATPFPVAAAGPGHAYGLAKHVDKARANLGAANTASTIPLQYGGGSILHPPKLYLVYWGPEWSAGFSTGGYSSGQAQTYINTFF